MSGRWLVGWIVLAALWVSAGEAGAAVVAPKAFGQESAEAAAAAGDEEETSFLRKLESKVEELFQNVNAGVGGVLFWDVTSPFRTPPEAPAEPTDLAAAADDVEAYQQAIRDYRAALIHHEDGFLEVAPPEPTAPSTLSASLRDYAVAVVDHEEVANEFGKKGLPLMVLWLLCGALFMTLRMGFINVRGFKHAIRVTRGKYDNPADEGEVSHFQALCSALSATVGLGNIAGVGIAVAVGGPGATFWMILAGFLGMSTKFVECTLGQKFRKVDAQGVVSGGPMQYLYDGFKAKNLAGLGKFLAIVFALMCIGGSLGGGNTFQVNQSLNAVKETFPSIGEYNWAYGLVMAVMVGIVIIGGIRRIATTAEKIVPLMCGLYVMAALWIILSHAADVPACFAAIVSEAFSPRAGLGGAIGVMVLGIRRAVFSNEAGVGSASIAHSAAKTDEPVREGIVALLEPFIDTIVVCTMTGLVIVITGVYLDPDNAKLLATSNGAGLTSRAFGEKISWFPYVLSIAVMLFAYSTMISWSYYGERCWAYLFGAGSSMVYRMIFVLFTFLGSLVTATAILDFSDLMILAMSFPNLIGLYFMSGLVKRDLNDYMGKLDRGEFKVYE